ncbi:MAG: STAS domain-containing protein [Methylophilaceae bacterium]|nr:STAS domain-containing protein [Methylophilaceae bacterium]
MITRHGNTLRVTVAMNMETASALLDAGTVLLGEGETQIDLGEVPDVDSAALGLIFEWIRHARKRNGTVVFTHLPPSLVSLATLYGALDLIPLKATDH